MNFETSRISTIFGEEGFQKNKTQKASASPQKIQIKSAPVENPNDLNNWNICNPVYFEDKLPQPFRLINKIIYKQILGKVNEEIDKIEKAKLSHNYEGRVREIPPSSSMDLKGVTCFAHPNHNPQNHMYAGDKFGNLTVFDLNKKSTVLRMGIAAERRVIDLNVVQYKYEDTELVHFSTVCFAHKEVYIYRMKISDLKPQLAFIINCSRSTPTIAEGVKASEMPYKAVMSHDARYISVILYNGNVEVYRIPDPPAVIPVEVNPNVPQKSAFSLPPLANKTPAATLPPGGKPNLQINTNQAKPNANEPKELKKCKLITVRTAEIDQNPEEKLFALLLNEIPVIPVPVEEKKDTKPDPKAKKTNDKKEPDKPSLPADFYQTKYEPVPEQLFKKIDRSSEYGDVSDPLDPPKYFPYLSYGHTSLVIQDTTKKQFSIEKTAQITSEIYCAWNGTRFVDTYILEKPTKDDVPIYLTNLLFNRDKGDMKGSQILSGIEEKAEVSSPPQQTKNLPSPKGEKDKLDPKGKDKGAVPEPPKVECEVEPLASGYFFNTIYPITAAAINKNRAFLAIGMADGSLIVWDLLYRIEKYSLDKHRLAVSCIEFFEDWRVISGGTDGTVIMHDLQARDNTKKYEHVYKLKDNPIVGITVNDAGIAFVLDKLNNLRTYDLYHFEKVFRVSPSPLPNNKALQFCKWPLPLMDIGKEQFCILIEEPTEDPNISNYNKTTRILIYRILENLVTIFPGLGNVMKRGLDRTKTLYSFSKLSIAELKNPNYEIPSITGAQIGEGAATTQSKKTDSKSHSRYSTTKRSSSKSNVTSTKSFLDTTYRDNQGKKKSNEKKGGLTQAILHPEKYLSEKLTFPLPELVNPIKKTMDNLRNRNEYKVVRNEEIQSYNQKIKDELDKQEEYERLLKRKEMLEKTKIGTK